MQDINHNNYLIRIITMKYREFIVVILVIMATLTANAQDYPCGDVNRDGDVNIADVNEVIDVIIGCGSNMAADVNRDGEINIADINVIIDIILYGTAPIPDGHEWVDLGLPSGTLWATMNVGASTPEGYGDYFAWGETEPKDDNSWESWESYKWCNGSGDSLTKYCTDSSYGIVDGKTFLDPEDDAACVNWGPSWRMPSMEQIYELHHCSSVRTEINGVKGRLLTGPSGNTMFLPGTENASADWIAYSGDYWSRECNNDCAEGFWTDAGYNSSGTFSDFRCHIHPVRAVRGSESDFYVEQHSLELGDVLIGDTAAKVLTIVNNTKKAITLVASADDPFLLKHGEDSASSMTVEIPSQSSTLLTVIFNGSTPGQFNGNVTIRKLETDAGQFLIPVHVLSYTGATTQQEWVDLGLSSGTLWATYNVGASSPEENGDYFAWGETDPKDYYDWETYKWCNGSSESLTKYCTDSKYGTVDNKAELDHEDDAAFVNMGPMWRMPTREQLDELHYDCTWKRATLNGVDGVLAIGPNGNSMFVPRAGRMIGSELKDAGWSRYYWSREIYSYDNPVVAFGTDFSTIAGSGRSIGFSVRAVLTSRDDVFIEQQNLDLVGVPIGENSTGELTIVNNTMESITMTATVDEPFSFKQGEGSALNKTIVVPAKSYSPVEVMFTATTPGEFSGNVTFQSPALNGGKSVIPVSVHAFTDDFMQPDYVDLGLPSGTLWATRDIGASSPEEGGYKFIWGGTTPINSGTRSTDTLSNESKDDMKACSMNSLRDIYDYLPEPGSEFGTGSDAAYVNWGPEWRTPSLDQIVELTQSCTCSKALINGVIARLVTGPNGKTMLLPVDGSYWSRTSLKSNDNVFGMYLHSDNFGWGIFWGARGWGSRVRAVRVTQN